jgi:hypothetical protein
MVYGKYFVVVDVNRDGKITELMDIIDAVKKDGTTILDNAAVVGFEVQ